MTKAKAQSLLATGKKIAAWAAIGTAVLAFLYQGYMFVSVLREKTRHEQKTEDRLGVVEKTTTETQTDVKKLTEQVSRIEGRLESHPSYRGLTIAPQYGEGP